MWERPGERRTRRTMAVVTLLVLAASVALALWRMLPPAPAPAGAPPTAFSAARALLHVREIARAPHSTGTPENARVREYLVTRLRQSGLEVAVQAATVARPDTVPPRFAWVHNVVARLPGTRPGGPALMLAAHYDSVPTGPGAGDDGAGVAAILETVRALKAGPPLKNDLLVVITDGEERGLFGAHAFVDENPGAKSVAVAVNLEARGCDGPALMFETSEGNAGLVGAYARAVGHPAASSLFYAVYKQMPNDTDLTVFKRAGMAGLNFSFVGGWNRYHSPADTPDNLDPRSLQHVGDAALALAREFGDAPDLKAVAARANGDAVFFDVLGVTLAAYPQWLAYPLTGLAAFLFAAALAVGFKRRHLSPGGFAVGLLLLPLALAAVGAAAGPVWGLFVRAFPDVGRVPWGDPYRRPLFEAAFVCLTLFVCSLLQGCASSISARDRASGALVWWFLLLLGATYLLPGATYAFVFPLLFQTLALVCLPSGRERTPDGLPFALLLLAGALCLILWTPLNHGLFLLFSLSGAPIPCVAAALVAGLLTPQVGLLLQPRAWPLPAGALLLGLALLLAGGLTNRFDAAHPRVNTLFYAQGTGAGRAVWASREGTTDDWTARYTAKNERTVAGRAFLPWGTPGRYRVGDAPDLRLPGGEVAVLETTEKEGERTVRLRVRSPRRSPDMYVRTEAFVTRAEVAGKPFSPRDGRFGVSLIGVPDEGVEIALTLRADAKKPPPLLTVDDYAHGLPHVPGAGVPTRPPGRMRAVAFPDSDTALVRTTFPLGPPQKQRSGGSEIESLMPSLKIPELIMNL